LKLSICDDEEDEQEARTKTNMEHKEPPQDSKPKNNMPPTSKEQYA